MLSQISDSSNLLCFSKGHCAGEDVGKNRKTWMYPPVDVCGQMNKNRKDGGNLKNSIVVSLMHFPPDRGGRDDLNVAVEEEEISPGVIQ